MADLLAQGWVTALIALVLVVEAALLILRRVLSPRAALLLVLPGAGFLLAIQAALSGAHWSLVLLGLALAGLAHLADLRERLRR
ncbi:hypothetical protein [Falsiroseomonas oryzae]|uniref:hypothetical protein n=1 Tax=Falsiroseomonas oryzae TaxID=2766473 RepID=UPI0022EB016B|nr:hypothetical protein [Roseomonas sp. MO-31]